MCEKKNGSKIQIANTGWLKKKDHFSFYIYNHEKSMKNFQISIEVEKENYKHKMRKQDRVQ